MNSTLFARSICVALLRLLAVAKALAEQAGSAIYPSLDLKVVKNGNLNREGYMPLAKPILLLIERRKRLMQK
jgi:hypothetical protein